MTSEKENLGAEVVSEIRMMMDKLSEEQRKEYVETTLGSLRGMIESIDLKDEINILRDPNAGLLDRKKPAAEKAMGKAKVMRTFIEKYRVQILASIAYSLKPEYRKDIQEIIDKVIDMLI